VLVRDYFARLGLLVPDQLPPLLSQREMPDPPLPVIAPFPVGTAALLAGLLIPPLPPSGSRQPRRISASRRPRARDPPPAEFPPHTCAVCHEKPSDQMPFKCQHVLLCDGKCFTC
jgi:hypothetical protein